MTVFINRGLTGNCAEIRLAIPMEKISYVQQRGKTINIAYNSGEYTFLNEVCTVAVPKVETVSITYDRTDIADDVMRSFYVACEQGKGAFYFS